MDGDGPLIHSLAPAADGDVPRHTGDVTLPSTTAELRLVFEDRLAVTRTHPDDGSSVADHELVYRETIVIPAGWRA